MNVDINQRRAAAIRRHRGKPHVIAALKAKVYDLVRIDMPLKEIAALVELSNSKACKWIHVLGFRQIDRKSVV